MNKSPYDVLNDYEWLNDRYNVQRMGDVAIAKELSGLYGVPCHRTTVARARERLGISGRGRGRMAKPSRFSDREWLAEEIRTKSFAQIGRENGCSGPHVRNWVHRHGLVYNVGKKGRRQGPSTGNWRGGRVKRGPYWWLHRALVEERWPNHPRLGLTDWSHKQEHILVMEDHEGRVLQPGEDVHHGPGGQEDNRIENLTLMKSRGAHISEHWAMGHEAKKFVELATKYRQMLLDAGIDPDREAA